MRGAVILAGLLRIAAPPAPVQAAPPLGPFLRGIEARMPGYEAVEAIRIKVPASAMELGRSNDLYHCWKLKLTGEHGRKARYVLDRLSKVRNGISDGKKRLSMDMIRLAAAPAANAPLQARITEGSKKLDTLLERYNALLRLGTRSRLLKTSKKSWFNSRQVISPLIKKDDYTMIYDDSTPECPTRKAGT